MEGLFLTCEYRNENRIAGPICKPAAKSGLILIFFVDFDFPFLQKNKFQIYVDI